VMGMSPLTPRSPPSCPSLSSSTKTNSLTTEALLVTPNSATPWDCLHVCAELPSTFKIAHVASAGSYYRECGPLAGLRSYDIHYIVRFLILVTSQADTVLTWSQAPPSPSPNALPLSRQHPFAVPHLPNKALFHARLL